MGYHYPPASKLDKLLEALRTVPADSHATTDDMLSAVSGHLLGKNATPSGNVHWFCKKAEPLTREAAAFSLRLFAYDSPLVIQWKGVLHDCLSCCAACVDSFEAGKITWRTTYFGAFSPSLLKQFFTSLEQWERDATVLDIESVNELNQLTSIPSGTIYRILSNYTIFSDTRVLSYIQNHMPSIPVVGWPERIPPFAPVLLVVEHASLRAWAKDYLDSNNARSSNSTFNFSPALSVIIGALDRGANANGVASDAPVQIHFADQQDLWSGIHSVLRLIHGNWFQVHSDQSRKLQRIILSHLQDQSPHFCEVLKCFNFLLKRLAKGIWKGEGSDYPQIIFDFIRNNPRYQEELEAARPPDSGLTFVTWFPEFLITIRDSVIYGNIFTNVVDFLATEARRDRLRDSRPNLVNTMMNAIHTEYERVVKNEKLLHRNHVAEAIDKYADLILSVAYGTGDEDRADWVRARNKARELVELVLEENVKSIQSAIRRVCEVLIRHKQNADVRLKTKAWIPPLPALFVQTNMWKTMYATLQSCSTSQKLDSEALAKVLLTISKIGHFTLLRREIFANGWTSDEGNKVVEDINNSLSVMQEGLSASISAYSDYCVSSDALQVLQCKGAGTSITTLLLSPVEDFQKAAKTLITLAFDVDGRMECIRYLLTNLPQETFEGIFQFLHTFCRYAELVPEACNLSAMLVLCFADIVDVLCGPDGLLHGVYFLAVESKDGPAALSFEFWKLLTKALCLIYKRTPTWAGHVDTPNMVIWMRDALILARDMLKQWRVIESAATLAQNLGKPDKRGGISKIGAEMIQSLQDFLPELLKWLRLTDEELLHQSFALLLSVFDVMKESHITPSSLAISKLSKYVETANNSNETITRERKTRLDQGRLSQLSEILLELEEKPGEDDIEIISPLHSVEPVKDAKSKDAVDKRPYIQGKIAKKKIVHARMTASSSNPRTSKFSEKDQQKLEASIPQASFRKSQPQTGSSKVSSSVQPSALSKVQGLVQVSEESDDSDDESESEDDSSSLKELGKVPSPKKPKPVKVHASLQPTMPKERRQVKMLDIPLNADPNNFARNRQHAPATRPRLDCSALHKTILSWNYNHNGSVPPGPPLQLVNVPDKFRDYNQYFQVFQPLLLTECWAQILAAKDERRDSYQCKIESRQYVDNWIDLDLTIPEAVKKDWYLTEADIVLIKHASQHEKCIMAKVKSYRGTMAGIQLTIRCFIQRGEVEDPGLTIQSHWQISKVFSLSTLDREYRALISLPYSDVCQFIMQPRLYKVPNVNQDDVIQTMCKYNVNEPQATAILKALKTKGISLIQGPPGTGKTSTICGLISQFIANRPRPIVTIVPGNKRGATVEDPGPTARVLVCAPSNAAIDELAQRIRDGHLGSNINVVRIGPEQTIGTSIRDISLDYLVDKKLDSIPSFKPTTDIGDEIRSIRQELEAVKSAMRTKKDELQDGNPSITQRATLENELKTLNSRRQNLNSKLDQKQDQRKSDSRAQDTARRNARQQVLFRADIICSTLAGAGHDSLDSLQFDMLVIDEAAQAIELSSLIPLKSSGTQCVMVGDPQQLPPTVISPEATNYRYNQSLFVRLQQSNTDAVHLLSIQYRMHPDISALPSRVFYDGRLLDGPEMAKKTRQPWHDHDKFGTYKFINVSWGFEESAGRSLSNSAECHLAADLFQCLRREYSTINFDFRIGVVSMYKAQILALRKTFQDRFGNEIARKIDFNTVDGFQGQEKDIIILSCVRASTSSGNVGFTGDIRRMNVALTRAKSSLFILGHAATLERSNTKWKEIVGDARSRESLMAINAKYYSTIGPRPAPTAEPVLKKRKSQARPALPVLSTPREFTAAVHASVGQSSRDIIARGEPATTANDPGLVTPAAEPVLNGKSFPPQVISKLSTPQDFSAAVQASNLTLAGQLSKNQVPVREEPTTVASDRRGTKRPAESVEHITASTASTQNPGRANNPLASSSTSAGSLPSVPPGHPQPPPLKRIKAKKPPSLFLPSRRPAK